MNLEPEHGPRDPSPKALRFNAMGLPSVKSSDLEILLTPSFGLQGSSRDVELLLQKSAPQIAAIGHCIHEDIRVRLDVKHHIGDRPEVRVNVFLMNGMQLQEVAGVGPWPDLRDRIEAVARESGLRGEYRMSFSMKADSAWPEGPSVYYRFDFQEQLRELDRTGDCEVLAIIRGDGSPETNIGCIRAMTAFRFAEGLSKLELPPDLAIDTLKRVVRAEDRYYPPNLRVSALVGLGAGELLHESDAQLLADVLTRPVHHPSGFGQRFETSSEIGIRIEVCSLVRRLLDSGSRQMQMALKQVVGPVLKALGQGLHPQFIPDWTVSGIAARGEYSFYPHYLDSQVLATLVKLENPDVVLHEHKRKSR